ncbi:DUF3253 domain-containing protein [Oharaeibacter diazotrophicus]|uniref:Uncharacterized protein DUF3253 n=1 Tax=Oharaeibacter diazotrophicus TaxID=1920512 RepID=A0A4V6PVI1_9HYPH|nr:DUF3253 domain-containing protein [Oharaeibacter diazotrophicus]TDP86638.1 uncharacterized protein DUF3253 [Oharaeibacter diazotrophicus]BBE71420.1 hypothetical protein OHA_1_00994 [Pleomorphomonas sp. SM30]GLS78179.1 hypothetical protein GCM10007904_35160 [Oharaeibacter diazotrophicus]
MTIDPRRVKAAEIRARMTSLAAERGPGRNVDPMEVAVAIAGHDEKIWRRLMKPIKEEAKRLAAAGEIVVLRKGKPTDPETLRGLWRFRALAEGEAPPVFEPRAAAPAPTDEDDDLDDFDFDDDED